MSKISIERKYILEYIKDILNESKVKSRTIYDAKYHHCTSYEDASSILKYGILSMGDIKKKGIKTYTEELMEIMKDTDSHINGIDTVSLSVVGLDDLYHNEDEFNPYSPEFVDFCIDSTIPTSRSTLHYGNEYLSKESITLDRIKSTDIRLLEYINRIGSSSLYSVEELLKKYNCIKDIAVAIKLTKQDISLREMSDSNITMDIDKLSSLPTLSLKAYNE